MFARLPVNVSSVGDGTPESESDPIRWRCNYCENGTFKAAAILHFLVSLDVFSNREQKLKEYLLHVKKNQKSQLFIDRHLTFRRDGYSSGGVDRAEVEANQFRAALLMPRLLRHVARCYSR